ncbi:MAG: formyltransferase family protein [Eubacterium sp.]
MKRKMKVAFATCVQLGQSCIQEIYQIGGKLDLLITLNDKKDKEKSGRIYLDDFAKEKNISLLKINNINDLEVVQVLKEKAIDWLFIIGWSQIAKETLLDTPTLGCIGMHPTLLPKGRGRASIPWAILKGLKETGVSMFKLDTGVDTGAILGQIVIPLKENETAIELYDKVNQAHIQLISKYWENIINEKVELLKQNDKDATEWLGRKPSDGEITKTMTVEEADRLVRAVTHPYPGAFYIDDAQKITIWKTKTQATLRGDEKVAIQLKNGYLIPLDFEQGVIDEKQVRI